MTCARRERSIQRLLRAHPYLLDKDLIGTVGKCERRVASGRLDIDFETPKGLIVVECKVEALTNNDLAQLRRYLEDLASASIPVYKAYLVGHAPRKKLDQGLISQDPPVQVKLLIRDLPTFLALSQGRHYFDANMDVCPYDGTPRIPGKEIMLKML